MSNKYQSQYGCQIPVSMSANAPNYENGLVSTIQSMMLDLKNMKTDLSVVNKLKRHHERRLYLDGLIESNSFVGKFLKAARKTKEIIREGYEDPVMEYTQHIKTYLGVLSDFRSKLNSYSMQMSASSRKLREDIGAIVESEHEAYKSCVEAMGKFRSAKAKLNKINDYVVNLRPDDPKYKNMIMNAVSLEDQLQRASNTVEESDNYFELNKRLRTVKKAQSSALESNSHMLRKSMAMIDYFIEASKTNLEAMQYSLPAAAVFLDSLCIMSDVFSDMDFLIARDSNIKDASEKSIDHLGLDSAFTDVSNLEEETIKRYEDMHQRMREYESKYSGLSVVGDVIDIEPETGTDVLKVVS